MLGVTFQIGDKSLHTCKDWGLAWSSIDISAPEPQLYTIPIPGMNGLLDLSEALTGEINYNNRNITLKFFTDKNPAGWTSLLSDMWNYMQGRQVKIITDIDKGFYYEGRVSISSTKESYLVGNLTITCSVKPYKFELESGLVPWVWDTFNFETGIIREYNGLVVNDELKLIVPGRRKTKYLTINSTADMTLIFNNTTFQIKTGSFKYLNIGLTEGNNLLTFTGNGIISIDYKGGSL